eukprot:6708732-Ditylum_brightwellii.AAC.1
MKLGIKDCIELDSDDDIKDGIELGSDDDIKLGIKDGIKLGSDYSNEGLQCWYQAPKISNSSLASMLAP